MKNQFQACGAVVCSNLPALWKTKSESEQGTNGRSVSSPDDLIGLFPVDPPASGLFLWGRSRSSVLFTG